MRPLKTAGINRAPWRSLDRRAVIQLVQLVMPYYCPLLRVYQACQGENCELKLRVPLNLRIMARGFRNKTGKCLPAENTRTLVPLLFRLFPVAGRRGATRNHRRMTRDIYPVVGLAENRLIERALTSPNVSSFSLHQRLPLAISRRFASFADSCGSAALSNISDRAALSLSLSLSLSLLNSTDW